MASGVVDGRPGVTGSCASTKMPVAAVPVLVAGPVFMIGVAMPSTGGIVAVTPGTPVVVGVIIWFVGMTVT